LHACSGNCCCREVRALLPAWRRSCPTNCILGNHPCQSLAADPHTLSVSGYMTLSLMCW
jgi:hypothetical protein